MKWDARFLCVACMVDGKNSRDNLDSRCSVHDALSMWDRKEKPSTVMGFGKVHVWVETLWCSETKGKVIVGVGHVRSIDANPEKEMSVIHSCIKYKATTP